MRRALGDRERGLARLGPQVSDDALRSIARLANGDARSALNVLELAVQLAPASGGRRTVTDASIREAAQQRTLLYDKAGEEHYNLISALHKSLRDSDPDAALYWMTRMLDSGEEPLYVVAPARPLRVRGHRQRRPPRAHAGAGRQGRLRLPRLARGRAGHRAGHAVPGAGAEVQRRLRRRSTRRRPTCRNGRPSRCRCTSATRPPGS